MKWDRSCTDIPCCILFIVFLLAMLICSGFAISKGNPKRIMTPFDSVGNACGSPKLQCSSSNYVFPQDVDCPVVPEGETEVAYDKPGCDKTAENHKCTVMVPKARSFEAFPAKYFPFQSPTNLFTAVCAKACPATQYSASTQTGICVKDVTEGDTAGVAGTDYIQITEA